MTTPKITTPYAATPALPRAIAAAISDALEQAAWPEALAVSMTEMDEAEDLWNVQAMYETEPTANDIQQALEFAELDRLKSSLASCPIPTGSAKACQVLHLLLPGGCSFTAVMTVTCAHLPPYHWRSMQALPSAPAITTPRAVACSLCRMS
jgi:hypothetical protein